MTLGEKLEQVYNDIKSNRVNKVEVKHGDLIIKAYSMGKGLIRLDIKDPLYNLVPILDEAVKLDTMKQTFGSRYEPSQVPG